MFTFLHVIESMFSKQNRFLSCQNLLGISLYIPSELPDQNLKAINEGIDRQKTAPYLRSKRKMLDSKSGDRPNEISSFHAFKRA